MLTTDLLNRSLGELTPADFARDCASTLVHAIQPAPNHVYNGGYPAASTPVSGHIAHGGGVNAMAIDRFEGR